MRMLRTATIGIMLRYSCSCSRAKGGSMTAKMELTRQRRGWTRLGIVAAMALLILPASAGAQSAAPDKSLTVVVEVEGSLPGFRSDQLSAYVTEQMEAADITDWQ